MALDPRTPVVVGVGQVTIHPEAVSDPAARPEPLDLMVAALRAATEDASGASPGAAASAGEALLRRAGSLRVVAPLGWHTANAPLAVAGRLGLSPAELILTAIGGNGPQAMMHDACRAIAGGALDVALVTGAEAMYARAAARRLGAPTPAWTTQPDGTPPPVVAGIERAGSSEREMAAGVVLPIHAYPLFENALRAANGWSIDTHRARIGALWSRFSAVAAGNPHAWLRTERTPEEITTPGAANRMVSFPYPKLCTANLQVDQGAAFIVCSVEAARAAGLPEERWVFPLAGADAHDHWFISERPALHRSPAIALAGAAALSLAGVDAGALGPVDLYSCFPCVVQMAAAELGLPVDDPGRPLTMTGGLTFGGGPGNNYTTHGIAQLIGALRQAPGTAGMATGLGWYATKHSIGVYASRPPAHQGRHGFAWHDAQPEVDALPRCTLAEDYAGPIEIETYTVAFSRDGAPERGIVVCRTADGRRAWGSIDGADSDALTSLCVSEGVGRAGTLEAAGTLHLS